MMASVAADSTQHGTNAIADVMAALSLQETDQHGGSHYATIIEQLSSIAYQQRNDIVALQTELQRYRAASNTNQVEYAVAVIDGDGYLFRDDLVKRGQQGGRHAGQILHQALRRCLREHLQPDSGAVEIDMYLYYNRVGLTGSVSRFLEISERTFTQFMQGLSESHDRMTIVDCGQLKEAADSKLKATMRRHAAVPQCAAIIFGGHHDGGYVGTLLSLQTEHPDARLIVLRTEVAMARHYYELRQVVFQAITEPLFRKERLDTGPEPRLPFARERPCAVQYQSVSASHLTITSNTSIVSNTTRVPSVAPASTTTNRVTVTHISGTPTAQNSVQPSVGFRNVSVESSVISPQVSRSMIVPSGGDRTLTSDRGASASQASDYPAGQCKVVTAPSLAQARASPRSSLEDTEQVRDLSDQAASPGPPSTGLEIGDVQPTGTFGQTTRPPWPWPVEVGIHSANRISDTCIKMWRAVETWADNERASRPCTAEQRALPLLYAVDIAQSLCYRPLFQIVLFALQQINSWLEDQFECLDDYLDEVEESGFVAYVSGRYTPNSYVVVTKAIAESRR